MLRASFRSKFSKNEIISQPALASIVLGTGLAISIGFSPCLAEQAHGHVDMSGKQLAQGDAKGKSDEKASEKKETSQPKGAKSNKESKETKEKAGSKDSKDKKEDKDGKTSEGTSEKKKEEVVNELRDAVLTNVNTVTTDDLIDHAKEYLGKNIKFTANFASFCTLALNYKPAMRSNKTHISFLVKRADSKVPLSELKLALPIPKETEKSKNKMLTSLREDDKIEVTGKVFSAALDEPWIDVVAIKRLQEAKRTDDDGDEEE